LSVKNVNAAYVPARALLNEHVATPTADAVSGKATGPLLGSKTFHVIVPPVVPNPRFTAVTVVVKVR
jgi:hypothetical protein